MHARRWPGVRIRRYRLEVRVELGQGRAAPSCAAPKRRPGLVGHRVWMAPGTRSNMTRRALRSPRTPPPRSRGSNLSRRRGRGPHRRRQSSTRSAPAGYPVGERGRCRALGSALEYSSRFRLGLAVCADEPQFGSSLIAAHEPWSCPDSRPRWWRVGHRRDRGAAPCSGFCP
jgi:hypothetical protein